jgi:hypothetical protein
MIVTVNDYYSAASCHSAFTPANYQLLVAADIVPRLGAKPLDRLSTWETLAQAHRRSGVTF